VQFNEKCLSPAPAKPVECTTAPIGDKNDGGITSRFKNRHEHRRPSRCGSRVPVRFVTYRSLGPISCSALFRPISPIPLHRARAATGPALSPTAARDHPPLSAPFCRRAANTESMPPSAAHTAGGYPCQLPPYGRHIARDASSL
jgi:hypothetical protein